MTLSQLLTKLEKSQAYKDFQKSEENKKAFFCAGFFILNFKSNASEYSLDFRDDKNIFTFKVPINDSDEVIMRQEELIQSRKPLEKLNEKEAGKIKTDIEDLKGIVEKELEKNKVTNKLEEIIAVIQMLDGKLAWNLTCMCEGFTIITVQIDALSAKIIKFEKKNLMDFVSVKKPEKNDKTDKK